MITGYNNKIGVKPVETKQVKMEVVNGVAFISQKNQLTAMEVVFGDSKIRAGMTVYLEGDVITHKWFKEPVLVEGQLICICPVEQVRFVNTGMGWMDQVGVG